MFNYRKFRESREGFTLVELLVVVVILAILAAIAVPIFMNQKKKAEEAATLASVTALAAAIATADSTGGSIQITPTGLVAKDGTGATITVPITPVNGPSVSDGPGPNPPHTPATVPADTPVDSNNWCVSWETAAGSGAFVIMRPSMTKPMIVPAAQNCYDGAGSKGGGPGPGPDGGGPGGGGGGLTVTATTTNLGGISVSWSGGTGPYTVHVTPVAGTSWNPELTSVDCSSCFTDPLVDVSAGSATSRIVTVGDGATFDVNSYGGDIDALVAVTDSTNSTATASPTSVPSGVFGTDTFGHYLQMLPSDGADVLFDRGQGVDMNTGETYIDNVGATADPVTGAISVQPKITWGRGVGPFTVRSATSGETICSAGIGEDTCTATAAYPAEDLLGSEDGDGNPIGGWTITDDHPSSGVPQKVYAQNSGSLIPVHQQFIAANHVWSLMNASYMTYAASHPGARYDALFPLVNADNGNAQPHDRTTVMFDYTELYGWEQAILGMTPNPGQYFPYQGDPSMSVYGTYDSGNPSAPLFVEYPFDGNTHAGLTHINVHEQNGGSFCVATMGNLSDTQGGAVYRSNVTQYELAYDVNSPIGMTSTPTNTLPTLNCRYNPNFQ